MKNNIEEIASTRRKITVSFDAKEVEQERQDTFKDFLKNSKIQGFRPGKAPAALVEKTYSKGIDAAAERALTQKALQELNGIKDLDIYSVVSLDRKDADGGKNYEFVVDVYPDFELPSDLKTEVELPEPKATDEEVQNGLNYYLNQRASYNEVDRPIEKGDFVRLSYNGKVDGKEISQIAPELAMFGKQASTWEEAGNENAPGVRGIVNGIIGMKKGEKKTLSHEFPAEFENKELAGKTADYDVEIFEVREKKLPEINEEFLKPFEAKTKEEFEDKIRKDIEQEKNTNNEVMKRQRAVEQLMEKVKIEVPESALEDEKQMILEDMMMRFMSSGASRADIEKNKELLYESASKDADMRAKMRIFLNRVAKANNLKVESEDMSRMVWQEAMRMRIKPDDLLRQLRKDPAKVNRMRSDALIQKAINFIAEKAEVKLKKEK